MPLKLHHPHSWNLTPAEAVKLQANLRAQVKAEPLPESVDRISGVDVGFRGGKAHAAVAVISYPSLELLEQASAEVDVAFPYIPGLLSFREAPAILGALERLATLPDILLIDGQGIAHPRRFGIASHLGILLDMPTIGCAKSLLVGSYSGLGEAFGNTAEVRDAGEVIGMALHTRLGTKPLIISVGHRADLPTAVRLVLTCTRGYRLPEPTRLAHRLASQSSGDLSGLGPLFA